MLKDQRFKNMLQEDPSIACDVKLMTELKGLFDVWWIQEGIIKMWDAQRNVRRESLAKLALSQSAVSQEIYNCYNGRKRRTSGDEKEKNIKKKKKKRDSADEHSE